MTTIESKRTIMPDLVGPVKVEYPDNEEVLKLLKGTIPLEEMPGYNTLDAFLGRADIVRLFNRLPDAPKVPREQMSIMFYPTNITNRTTCLQNCQNCYLQGLPPYEVSMEEAPQIVVDLRERGYVDTGLTPPDSFAENFLAYGTKASGSGYRFDELKAISWSAGATIAKAQNWETLLNLAYEQAGFRNVFINGQQVAGTPVPFKGVAKAETIIEAIKRIQAWNTKYQNKKLGIGLTFTITRENNTLDNMRQMLKFCLDNGIDLFRFNRFNLFGMKRPELEQYVPSPTDVYRFFGNFARLMREVPPEAAINLSFSQDFGDRGIKQAQEFIPTEYADLTDIGRCRAGRYFLTIVQDKRITDQNRQLIVAACTDGFKPIVGQVVKADDGKWDIEWDQKALNRIYYLRELTAEDTGEPLLYGCFGGNVGDPRFNDPRVEKILYSGDPLNPARRLK